MQITTHSNDMWGVIVWCGDVDGQAALITSSKEGSKLWVFKYLKGGWFKSDKSYWSHEDTFENKDEAFKKLKVAPER